MPALRAPVWMLTWTVATFVTLLEASWLRTTTQAVNPGCHCVEYDGFAGAQTNGSFLSPNWPEPYQEDIECLLYQFVGASGELVEITFFQFELAPKDPVSGRCMDYVRIYQDLEDDAAVNEKSLWQHELCGSELSPGSKFYSKGRALIFEFHSATLNDARMNKGFVGEYHFLKKRDYHIDGRRIQGDGCHYMIKSSEEQLKGNIYSPHFPYYYPSNTKCIYYFHASPGQNIQIVVKELHVPLPIDATCDFADDYLIIYDEGSGSNGNNLVLLEKLCRSTDSGVLRISSRQHVQIHFITGSNEDYQGRGFHATYEFVNELPTPPPINGFEESAEIPAVIQPKSGDCQLRISSEEGKKSGNVTSPEYPATYPEGIKCRFTFVASSDERVKITFYEFNLYLPPAAEHEPPHYNATPRRCDEKNDHLTAHVLFDARMSKIDDFCGSETPPQLMSTQNFLTLEFIAKSPISVRESSRSDKKYRFLLHYKFVRDLDMQDMRAARDKKKVCGFIFNSSIATNGTLWSPNYPGYYPRQTECDYVFHGNEHEVVRIYFTYFDVEGYSQCNDDTKSDFVIFSNYQTHDRTNRRYCGTMTPLGEAIVSESNYFRMIFKSNGIFDATGFFARYQFVKPQTAQIKRVKSSRATAGPYGFCSRFANVLIVLAYLSVQLRFTYSG